jgi:hypothetical protein
MRKTLPFVLALILMMNLSARAQDLFGGKYSADEIRRLLVPRAQWTPFPPLADRDAWAKADAAQLADYVAFAEKNLAYKWPGISATDSLTILRTGSRSPYETVHFKKRNVLTALLVAEIAENKGRFLDQIANGVWSICEESWWGVPAHLPDGAGLPDVSAPAVDLFAATTAEVLAWVDYFLGEKLDGISPLIRRRLALEMQRRILNPLLDPPPTPPVAARHTGMTGRNRQPPNNWNPWICSNWLATALLLERDEARRAAHVAKILSTLDNFTNPYPADGGCDEGPVYWNIAAGSLYDCIALLNMATRDHFRHVLADEKIKNMGRFIRRARISENYVINFADAPPKVDMDGIMVWRFGRDIGDAGMMALGASFPAPTSPGMWKVHHARCFYAFFLAPEVRATPARIPLERDVWFPDLQVAAARDADGSDKGFYFAAKGGHNAESHNHNDIGNFIVYYDGLPVLIDVGNGKYTKQTFSGQRYQIWNTNSAHHNAPTINFVRQKNGRGFKAAGARFKADAAAAEFAVDIAGAYPKEAAVKRWTRTVTLHRGKSIVVRDETALEKTDAVTGHLMTCHNAEVTGAGEVTIHAQDKAGPADFVLKFTGAKAVATIEKIRLETESDRGVRDKWGDTLHRINFTVAAPAPEAVYTLEITRRPAAQPAVIAAAAAPRDLRDLAREQFAFAALQYDGMLAAMRQAGPDREPHSVRDGKLVTMKPTGWTSGFFPGALWLVHEQTGEPRFRAAAENHTARLAPIQHFTGTHDLGFMLGCSYGEGWRLTRDPAYRAVLIQGARSLATRFSPKTGLIRSWDNPKWEYPVIIDNMMNLGLLWFAGAETGEDAFRKIVTSHADKTLANHFRPDASSFHLVEYDPATGAVKKRQTVQGHADASSWSRGQAWALAGYAAAARYAGNPDWRAQAEKIARFIINHPRMPDDGIPYWDFDAPGIPKTAPRDASAGAVMALGLLDLAQQLGPEKGAPCRVFAEKQLRSLAGPAYRARLGENGNFLLMHSVTNLPAGNEVDVPLVYADYYFLKALSIVLGGGFSKTGVP